MPSESTTLLLAGGALVGAEALGVTNFTGDSEDGDSPLQKIVKIPGADKIRTSETIFQGGTETVERFIQGGTQERIVETFIQGGTQDRLIERIVQVPTKVVEDTTKVVEDTTDKVTSGRIGDTGFGGFTMFEMDLPDIPEGDIIPEGNIIPEGSVPNVDTSKSISDRLFPNTPATDKPVWEKDAPISDALFPNTPATDKPIWEKTKDIASKNPLFAPEPDTLDKSSEPGLMSNLGLSDAPTVGEKANELQNNLNQIRKRNNSGASTERSDSRTPTGTVTDRSVLIANDGEDRRKKAQSTSGFAMREPGSAF